MSAPQYLQCNKVHFTSDTVKTPMSPPIYPTVFLTIDLDSKEFKTDPNLGNGTISSVDDSTIAPVDALVQPERTIKYQWTLNRKTLDLSIGFYHAANMTTISRNQYKCSLLPEKPKNKI
jgi:hypothetical protein